MTISLSSRGRIRINTRSISDNGIWYIHGYSTLLTMGQAWLSDRYLFSMRSELLGCFFPHMRLTCDDCSVTLCIQYVLIKCTWVLAISCSNMLSCTVFAYLCERACLFFFCCVLRHCISGTLAAFQESRTVINLAPGGLPSFLFLFLFCGAYLIPLRVKKIHFLFLMLK